VDSEQFWSLVTIDKDVSNKSDELKKRLSVLSLDDLKDFDTQMSKTLKKLWHWDLWAAAYVMCGCNSEYDFLDFCNWLITQGKDVTDSVVESPDSLSLIENVPVKNDLPYPFCDELDLIAGLLYEEKSNEELEYTSVVSFQPNGKKFKTKAKNLKEHYPNLFKKYWQPRVC
jgi:hypothetical protein